MSFTLKNIETIKVQSRQDMLLQASELKKFGGTESEREERESRLGHSPWAVVPLEETASVGEYTA